MSYLEGKAVFVTGASSGIGEALARELARRGCRLGLLARRADRLAALAEELEGRGARAAWAAADVTDGEAVAAALDALARELEGCDVLVANAGFGRPEQPHKFRPGRAETIYETNLLGMVRAFDWALPEFYRRGSGHLVGIASIASFFGMPNTPSYSGSKAAMRIHLQSLRVTYRRFGIHVTTICPGYVATELTEKNKVPMPFLWPVDKAARRIAGAIEKRRSQVVFPWPMKALVVLMGLIPRVVLEGMFRWGGGGRPRDLDRALAKANVAGRGRNQRAP